MGRQVPWMVLRSVFPIQESGFRRSIMSGFLRGSTVWTRATQKSAGGTGLGLSIVKHGALLHGAKVTVDSVPGRGTRIEMQFPRGKPEIECK